MLLIATAALAFDSEPQPVHLQDQTQLFTNAAFTTGAIPADSPLAVQFSLEANGGATVEMDGQGDLTWPTALTLLFTGEAGSGLLALDASLDAVTEVIIDLSDYGYEGAFEIDRRSLHMDGNTFFDPFVLDGATVDRAEIVDRLDSTQLIYYSYEVWAGVSLDFEATMVPVITVGFEGVQWTNNDATIVTENTSAAMTPEHVANYLVDSVFTGAWDGDIALIFTPTIGVSAPFIGSIEIASFDIPVSLVKDAFEQDFPADVYDFPLPILKPGLDTADFGEVDMGAIATVNVPISDEGSLPLTGTAHIDGAGEFTVFPDQFNALPGTSDGLVVTFAPTAAGEQTASLVLTSNDPTIPDLTIPLVGNGADPSSDKGGDADEKISAASSSCGCASLGGEAGAPLGGTGATLALFGLVGLLVRRRRR